MKQAYGSTPDGTAVDLYTLTNADGVQAQITNFGGIVTSLLVPDRAGKPMASASTAWTGTSGSTRTSAPSADAIPTASLAADSHSMAWHTRWLRTTA